MPKPSKVSEIPRGPLSDDGSALTVRWVKAALRYDLYAPKRVSPTAVYVVGSVARGTEKPGSDLDLAVVIPAVRGKTSLSLSESFHSKRPAWAKNKRVLWREADFQFFYPDDPELSTYDKVPVPE